MHLLVTNENRNFAEVQLTRAEWDKLRPVVVSLRGGGMVADAIDPGAQRGTMPWRVRLSPSQLATLEQAAARL